MTPTLNNTGLVSETLDPISQQFVSYAATTNGPVLDMGCGYGVASLAALKKGATVTAADMESAHLDVLREATPSELASRLSCVVAVMPDTNFPPESFEAILSARALHFLLGGDVQRAISKFASWLAPGGKVFLVADTPYMRYWHDRAVPQYERLKAAGHQWPGLLDDFSKYLFDGAKAVDKPYPLNLLDPDILSTLCESAGLVVEQACFCGGGHPEGMVKVAAADKEHAGIIATKPQVPEIVE